MKFTVHYGKMFPARQTGKMLAAELAMKEFIIKNPNAKVAIIGPDDKSKLMAPYFNHGLGRPYDGI